MLGIVHSETANAYNNLALYIHLLNPNTENESGAARVSPKKKTQGMTEALKYAYHALHLYHLLDIPYSVSLANTHVSFFFFWFRVAFCVLTPVHVVFFF